MTTALFFTQNWINILTVLLALFIALYLTIHITIRSPHYPFFSYLLLGILILGTIAIVNLTNKAFILPETAYHALKGSLFILASACFLIAVNKKENP